MLREGLASNAMGNKLHCKDGAFLNQVNRIPFLTGMKTSDPTRDFKYRWKEVCCGRPSRFGGERMPERNELRASHLREKKRGGGETKKERKRGSFDRTLTCSCPSLLP